MASIRKQKNTWFAVITLADGTRTNRSTGIKALGASKEYAERKRQALHIAQTFEDTGRGNKSEAIIRKTMSELYNRVNPSRIEFTAVESFLKNWVERVELRNAGNTHTRYDQVCADFLKFLGKRASGLLENVSPGDIQGYVDEALSEGRKGKTLRNHLKILSSAFGYAMRQGLIATNPVTAVDIPDEASESKKPFTNEQVSAILTTASEDWKTAVYLGAYSGARLSDCANLTWANIDLQQKLLRYRPGKTKKHKKDVVCPLHPSLEAHLLSLKSSDDAKTRLCPTLFGRDSGGRSGLSQKFIGILEKADIENAPIVEGSGKGRSFRALGFHSFRHTFKTILVNAGIEVLTVDVLTGHAKKTVSETYIHRNSELLRTAVLKLPNF
jgi:integrase